MDELNELCESIDASVFSGDLVWHNNRRQLLKKYVGRWTRAIAEHEAYIAANPGAVAESDEQE